MKESILHRAWDEGNKVMHNNFQFIKSGDEGNDWIVFTSDKQLLNDKIHPLENPYFSQQFKIMRYVGFTAKEDKRVYEYDIIKTTFLEVGDKFIAEEINIVWFEDSIGCFVFSPTLKHRGLTIRDFWHRYTNCKHQVFEVIGNLYENPELIKEEPTSNTANSQCL